MSLSVAVQQRNTVLEEIVTDVALGEDVALFQEPM